jgi:enoyl-CoA hydratase/carnithine racemase
MSRPITDDVRLDIDRPSGLATITLDRPHALNAFTDATERGLLEAFDRTDADDDVRAVVLTGTGRAFCAGMDLADGGHAFTAWRTSTNAPAGSQHRVTDEQLPVRRDGGGRVTLRIFDSLKPVIGAVNGPAVGVGATMLLACDVRLASTTARFGFVFTHRGVVPESCSSWFLPRVVPMPVALEWMLTGRVFDADEALRHGLVRSVHAPGDLLTHARELAEEMSTQTSPVSTALTRRLLWQMLGAPHPMAAHELETVLLNRRGVSEDAREGVTAFLDKRPPEFRDRVTDLALPDALTGPAFDPTHLEDHREA